MKKNKKTIVIGDIHGSYRELNSLLELLNKNNEYNPKTDRIIFLGDYIDRGENSRLVIKKIRELQNENKKVIALKGNHEDMLLEYLSNINENWLYNGCNATLESYKGYYDDFQNDLEWIKKLPLYYEDKNFVYVHAGIDLNKKMSKQKKETLLWIRDNFIYNYKKYSKTVIFGHTPVQLLNNDNKPIFTQNGNIGIDTGCVFNGGALTALIIEGKEVKRFYQVEHLSKIKNITKKE